MCDGEAVKLCLSYGKRSAIMMITQSSPAAAPAEEWPLQACHLVQWLLTPTEATCAGGRHTGVACSNDGGACAHTGHQPCLQGDASMHMDILITRVHTAGVVLQSVLTARPVAAAFFMVLPPVSVLP